MNNNLPPGVELWMIPGNEPDSDPDEELFIPVEVAFLPVKELLNTFAAHNRRMEELKKCSLVQLRTRLHNISDIKNVRTLSKLFCISCILANEYDLQEKEDIVLKDVPLISTEKIYEIEAKWFILNMDDGVRDVVNSKEEAVKWCRASCLDRRKATALKRDGRSYEYVGPDNGTGRKTFYFGQWHSLRVNGWDWALQDWLKGWIRERLQEEVNGTGE